MPTPRILPAIAPTAMLGMNSPAGTYNTASNDNNKDNVVLFWTNNVHINKQTHAAMKTVY